jgi:hypothetical protein
MWNANQPSAHPLFRSVSACVALFMLAACGGGSSGPAPLENAQLAAFEGAPQFATGPIQTACKSNKRTATTSARCGCIQAAANLTLTADEQRRGARYFYDPEELQRMKLSDSFANERLWDRWERFAETAESMCRRT